MIKKILNKFFNKKPPQAEAEYSNGSAIPENTDRGKFYRDNKDRITEQINSLHAVDAESHTLYYTNGEPLLDDFGLPYVFHGSEAAARELEASIIRMRKAKAQ